MLLPPSQKKNPPCNLFHSILPVSCPWDRTSRFGRLAWSDYFSSSLRSTHSSRRSIRILLRRRNNSRGLRDCRECKVSDCSVIRAVNCVMSRPQGGVVLCSHTGDMWRGEARTSVGRLTRLSSIRGLSAASPRPAEVGLAGIASVDSHHVSRLPKIPNIM